MKKAMNDSNTAPSGFTLHLLSMKEVRSITGKSRSTIYRWIANGSFPSPVNIGVGSIAWPVEVIAEWREQQINQSKLIGSY